MAYAGYAPQGQQQQLQGYAAYPSDPQQMSQAAAAGQQLLQQQMHYQDQNSMAMGQHNDPELDSRSIYVGNVDYTTTPEDLVSHFTPCGTIKRVTILMDKYTGIPKGAAFIEFTEAFSVSNALVLNDSAFKGRQIKVSSKRPSSQAYDNNLFDPQVNAENDSRSIYIGNVEYSATREEIAAHFSSCGAIQRVTILVDRFTGMPKSSAFIEFSNSFSVPNALVLNNTWFKGRLINVTEKRTNIPGMNPAGFRGGRGGGGGGGGFRGGRGGQYRGGFRGVGAPRGRGAYGFAPY